MQLQILSGRQPAGKDKPRPRFIIPLYQPYLVGREKQYLTECVDTLAIAKGDFIPRFETAFGRYLGAPHAATVCNGTAALHLALLAAGIGPGDEVIAPTLTYIAAINVIAHVGATPVLADSIRSTWQLDPEQVMRRITDRTRAIMAVHLYGSPCDMEALTWICRKKNLLLIEDCAEALGATCNGRHVGTFGHTAAFSFFGNKTITTGEGGMVVARDAALLERACHMRGQGVSPVREYWHDALAFNFRMNNISAAVGLAQLEQIEGILKKKRAIADWYRVNLSDLPLELQQEQAGTTHSFWMCSALAADSPTRDALRGHLSSNGIETRPVFHPAHTMPVFFSKERFPIAESLSQRGFNLPSYPGLSEEQLDLVCSSIKQFYSVRKQASFVSLQRKVGAG
jgi:perosamine synthetase